MAADATNVRHTVTVTQRALLVSLYVPIAPEAMRAEDTERMRQTLASAATLIQTERDCVAAELQALGVCPWCNHRGEDPADATSLRAHRCQ